jgi:hypothetical protein
MKIKALAEGDDAAVAAAEHLFDDPIEAEATARFLADPNHHLLLAYDDTRRPVGFVSGVETTHPDKGTEMFLYELGVAPRARRARRRRARARLLRDVGPGRLRQRRRARHLPSRGSRRAGAVRDAVVGLRRLSGLVLFRAGGG